MAKFWSSALYDYLMGLTTTLAGDVTGAIGSNTVAKVNGGTVPAAGALTTGNVLQVTGASALSYSALNLAGGAGYVTGTLPVGNLPSAAGDVTGPLDATVAAKVNGATAEISTGADVGDVLMTTSAGAMLYRPVAIRVNTKDMVSTGVAGTFTNNAAPYFEFVTELDRYVQFGFHADLTRNYIVTLYVANSDSGAGNMRFRVDWFACAGASSVNPDTALTTGTLWTETGPADDKAHMYSTAQSANFSIAANANDWVIVRFGRYASAGSDPGGLDTYNGNVRVFGGVVK